MRFAQTTHTFLAWLLDRKHHRVVPLRLAECGYGVVFNPDEKRGRWFIAGRQLKIYASTALSIAERVAAARQYVVNATVHGGGSDSEPMRELGCSPVLAGSA